MAIMYSNSTHLKHTNFGSILNSVHADLALHFNFYKKGDENTAKEILKTLRDIKKAAIQLNRKQPTGVEEKISQELKNIFIQTLKLENKARRDSGMTGKLSNSFLMFLRLSSSQKAINANIFLDILGFFTIAAARSRGQIITSKIMVGGLGVGFSGLSDKIVDRVLARASELTGLAIDRYMKAIGNSSLHKIAKIEKRAGKTDLRMPSFLISAEATDLISRFLRAVSGHTFSLKNYQSKAWDKTLNGGKGDYRVLNSIDLHLGGKTNNLFKEVTGALSYLNQPPFATLHIFFRGMNYLAGTLNPGHHTTNEATVAAHFSHLRFLYELRGNKDDNAEFLIWNDPMSENITVRSTASIIANAIRLGSNYGFNLFGEVYLNSTFLDGLT